MGLTLAIISSDGNYAFLSILFINPVKILFHQSRVNTIISNSRVYPQPINCLFHNGLRPMFELEICYSIYISSKKMGFNTHKLDPFHWIYYHTTVIIQSRDIITHGRSPLKYLLIDYFSGPPCTTIIFKFPIEI